MQTTMAKVLLLCILLSPSVVLSQEKKVTDNIDRVMSAARDGEMIMPDKMVFQEGNTLFTLNKVLLFTNDSNTLVRNQSYLIIHKLGRVAKDQSEISKCVEALSKACHDKDIGIALYCSRSLAKYPRQYFSDKAKENISTALFPKTRTLSNIAQLTGYLKLQNSVERLSYIGADETESKKNRWYAHLALARIGLESSINYCLSIYKNQETNSELIEGMIPDLLYTRQKKVYGEVVKILYSDEEGCVSGNPNNERRILCGYLVMEQLAPYIEDFPLETHASGGIKGDNYPQALEELRTWFDKNKDFTIIDIGF